MNVNRVLIFLISFGTFSLSCDSPVSKIKTISVTENMCCYGSSYIDNDLDTFYYKLPFDITENSDYEIDENGKITILVTKCITSCGKIFVGNDNIANGLKYFRENCGISEKIKGIYELHTISIKKLNSNIYEPIWIWKNPITIEDYGFGKYSLLLNLEAMDFYKNGKIQSRLNLNFKTTDEESGYILYTISFVNSSKGWKLVSREQVNTIITENNCDRYLCDTILENFTVTESEKWEFSNEFFILKYSKNK